jgi:hypothetical protein
MVAFLLGALAGPAVAADAVPDLARVARDRLALTISGGATLGVHEAGTLYLLGQAANALDPGPELVLATGASAGSGNTLLSVFEMCPVEQTADPVDSLGWQVWVGSGFDQLTPDTHRSPVAVFSQDAVYEQLGLVSAAWDRGLREDCSVVVSLPVTRLQSVDVVVAPGLRLPRQTLRFVVRIDGRGPGQPPTLTRVSDPASYQLPLSGDPQTDLALLWEVVVASAAFPFAFDPVSIGYCDPDAPTCTEPQHTAWFIDGGVFDNVPLRMAHRLTADQPGVRHVYLDPAIRAYPELPPASASTDRPDLPGYLSQFLGGFVGQARSHEVFALAEHDPDVVEATHVPQSRFPQAGAHLNNFFGVFDRDLRVFDFTLGMVDAWAELPELAGDPNARAALAPRLDRPGWQHFACLQGWVDGDSSGKAACAGEEMHNFRVLTGVALARAWSACRDPAVAAQATAGHRVCANASSPPTELLPLLPGITDAAQLLQQPDEDDLSYTLRLMAAGGYQWTDLGLERDEAARAAGVMADRLAASVRVMAREQGNPVQARLLAIGGEQALAHVLAAPTDPRHLHLLGGTVAEIGASTQVSPRLAWARLHGVVQGDGLVSMLTRDAEELSISPGLGVEFDPAPRSTGALAPVLGARMTWQLSAADGAGSRRCSPALDARLCSQGVAQAYGAVTALGLFRTQVELDLHPWQPHDGPLYDLQIAVGPEF